LFCGNVFDSRFIYLHKVPRRNVFQCNRRDVVICLYEVLCGDVFIFGLKQLYEMLCGYVFGCRFDHLHKLPRRNIYFYNGLD
jgi:hypothetical protein